MRAIMATGFIKCDDCGEIVNDWDYDAHYDRVCLDCLAKAAAEWDYDPRANRGCHDYHQSR